MMMKRTLFPGPGSPTSQVSSVPQRLRKRCSVHISASSQLTMSEALGTPVGFGPEPMTLSTELLRVLTSGDAMRLIELLSGEGRPWTDGHVAIEVASPPPVVQTSCLLGVSSLGNTALHFVASRGHTELAAVVYDKAPCLAVTRNKGLDTPLHCAAKAGNRDVAEFLVSTMLDGGADGAAALRARNCLGATALHEAVRLRHAGVVDVLMAMAPDLASVTTGDGVSALYMAVVARSKQIVRLLLRPLPDGAPSPASSAGPLGRTALHAAATVSKDMVQEILDWKPVGPTLLNCVDSSGRTPLQFAILRKKFGVVELFLDGQTSDEPARISDNHGLFPVHTAAMVGSTLIIDELVKKFPDQQELVDDAGMNLLHIAVVRGNNTVVSYICQNDRFNKLLNATDFQGNTPLHLAAKYGHIRIVSTLLQMTSVEININNRDGLTAGDLAYLAYKSSRLRYFLDPSFVVLLCLDCAGTIFNGDVIHLNDKNEKSSEEEETSVEGYMKGNGTIASALIASVTFAASVTVPGGFIADDHPHPGTAILARRFAFRAFTASNTLAFLCSIVATCYFIYGGAREVPPRHRLFYNGLASGLLPNAVKFMIAAFAFGFHLVLGAANRGLMILVYFVSSASVLFCFPGIWVPFFLGYLKVLWRHGRWMRLLHEVRRILFAIVICATFIAAIVLEIALPNY